MDPFPVQPCDESSLAPLVMPCAVSHRPSQNAKVRYILCSGKPIPHPVPTNAPAF